MGRRRSIQRRFRCGGKSVVAASLSKKFSAKLGRSFAPLATSSNKRRAPLHAEVWFAKDVSPELMLSVLHDDALYCRMCGVAPSDIDDLTGIAAQFLVEMRDENSRGVIEPSNGLHPLCSSCYEGVRSLRLHGSACLAETSDQSVAVLDKHE